MTDCSFSTDVTIALLPEEPILQKIVDLINEGSLDQQYQLAVIAQEKDPKRYQYQQWIYQIQNWSFAVNRTFKLGLPKVISLLKACPPRYLSSLANTLDMDGNCLMDLACKPDEVFRNEGESPYQAQLELLQFLFDCTHDVNHRFPVHQLLGHRFKEGIALALSCPRIDVQGYLVVPEKPTNVVV